MQLRQNLVVSHPPPYASYLSPQEEIVLAKRLLRLSKNGVPAPIKFLRPLSHGKSFVGAYRPLQDLPLDDTPPSGIYGTVEEWLAVIKSELDNLTIPAENVYNMDEIGVLLSALTSLKVLVGKDELSKHRETAVKRTVITALECISARLVS
ncbi:uncharacterized protein ATNIH1004_011715 [Aspergillus tanneri]|uniref:Uncharacterized protein n=1 Tax=Aspergillus tanneri TaxID=1220188 RepID=A0A5M9MAL0_9EURO|nr:uncharacterized protein ATNIH1004_011715 [Aspergillus tanneri]KAA8641579.1 hypothetical protein ATNIH1004_011715 [Aspergillus tanneri]